MEQIDMSKTQLAAPELAAIDVQGLTRGSFLVKGALAAGAVYGTSLVSPLVSRAVAQEGDVGILNFALSLEYLEATFYERALKEVSGMSTEVKELAQEIQEHEAQHVESLGEAIQDLGGTPDKAPQVDFGNAFSSENTFLKTAATFENVGVGAYNGAAPSIKNPKVLGSAGAIVQIEARHVALIALQRGESITPDGAFAKALSQKKVLTAVKPFIKS